MTEAIQAENPNTIDAMAIIDETVENLKRINEDATAMEGEIQAGIQYATVGGDQEVNIVPEDYKEELMTIPSPSSAEVDSILSARVYKSVGHADCLTRNLSLSMSSSS